MRQDLSWATAVVSATRDLTAEIREITLRPDLPATGYGTGAHLVVRVMADGRADTRRYSLVGLPRDDGSWRIAVKRETPGRGGSRYMTGLPVGARLQVSAPQNYFELSQAAPAYLLIAGGIGITPLHGMAFALRRRGVPFRLVYGGRRRDEMAYLAELAELGPACAVFADADGAQIDLAAEIARLPARGEAYVCGPLGLLEAVKRAWAASGRPRAGLVFETFGATGRLPSLPFRVQVPALGLDLVVPPNRSMLDMLQDAGVDVLFNCRRGECGLCALKVARLFFTDAEHDATHEICTCVSRVHGGIALELPYKADRPLLPANLITRPAHA
jgi:ferredoxin-NADP reductase